MFEKVSIEEVSEKSFDVYISMDDLEDVVKELKRAVLALRASEFSHVGSPWVCYCDACCEARGV